MFSTLIQISGMELIYEGTSHMVYIDTKLTSQIYDKFDLDNAAEKGQNIHLNLKTNGFNLK
jgi:hypothetical protein